MDEKIDWVMPDAIIADKEAKNAHKIIEKNHKIDSSGASKFIICFLFQILFSRSERILSIQPQKETMKLKSKDCATDNFRATRAEQTNLMSGGKFPIDVFWSGQIASIFLLTFQSKDQLINITVTKGPFCCNFVRLSSTINVSVWKWKKWSHRNEEEEEKLVSDVSQIEKFLNRSEVKRAQRIFLVDEHFRYSTDR